MNVYFHDSYVEAYLIKISGAKYVENNIEIVDCFKFRCVKGLCQVKTGDSIKKTTSEFCHFTTILGQFFANYIDTFLKAEVLTVSLRV